MKQVTLSIPDDKFSAFMQAIKQFNFVKVSNKKDIELTSSQKKLLKGLKAAFREVELHQKGKIKLKTFDEVLNEL